METLNVRLCQDCVYVAANGNDDQSSMPDWEGFLEHWEGWLFGPDPDADDPEQGHTVRPGTVCEGCGTGLGGLRWDYLAVPQHGWTGMDDNLQAMHIERSV